MNVKSRSLRSRLGLTLIELILVIAILAILAALLLPKLDGLLSNAGHAAGASSAADLYGMLQVYKMTKKAYPDGWDTLTDGNNMWVGSVPGQTPTLGLDAELVPATNPILVAEPLSASDVTALNSAGIFNLYILTDSLNTAGTKTRPGDMFTTVTPASTSQSVAVVSNASAKGKKIIDHIYPANSLNAGANSGTIPATTSKLVVFGFSPYNTMVGTSLAECPSYANVDPALVYNRLLVVFEITTSGKATVKTILGADGDLISDMIANASKTPS